MATYQVLPEGVPIDSWEGFEKSRFKDRPLADDELRDRIARGERPQLVRWENDVPIPMEPVPAE